MTLSARRSKVLKRPLKDTSRCQQWWSRHLPRIVLSVSLLSKEIVLRAHTFEIKLELIVLTTHYSPAKNIVSLIEKACVEDTHSQKCQNSTTSWS